MSLLVALSLASALFQSPVVASDATVSGVVLEEDSQKPLSGAEVTLIGLGRPSPRLRESTHKAVTDREGRYRLEGLEAGKYRVIVQKAGYARLEGPDLPEVSVGPGMVRESLNFTLKKGAVIVGRVVDDNGEPVLEAQVMILRKPPAHLGRVALESQLPLFPAGQMAQTNDLGEFRIFGLLPNDEYFVQAMPRMSFGEASPPGPNVLMPTFFPGTLDWRAAQPIAVGAGQTSAEVVIRMISVPAFQVSGVVIDDTGRPVANALIRLVREGTRESPFIPPHMTPSHTDPSGKFTISNVTSGNYTLLAIAPVVTSRSPAGAPRGANGGSFTFSSGAARGPRGRGVTTEMTNGVITEYDDDAGTRVAITINQASADGLEITVRRSPR